MSKAWIPSNFDEVRKRAAGRRRYHAERQAIQFKRRIKVLHAMENGTQGYGAGVKLARVLGVSLATISRDMAHWHKFRAKLGESADNIITTILRANNFE